MKLLRLIVLHRRALLTGAAVLPLAACVLPVTHAVGDWARTASVAIDQPPMVAPSDGMRALQVALARYFFSIGILADHGVLVLSDDGAALVVPVADLDPAARSDLQALDHSLRAAVGATPQEAATPPAPDAPPAPPDNRLHDTLHMADGHVQALLAVLAASATAAKPDPACPAGRDAAAPYAARPLYQQTLARIGEGHAKLTASGSHLEEQASARMMDEENLYLRRLLSRRAAIAAAGPSDAGCRA